MAVDKLNRKRLLGGATVLWSLSTFITGSYDSLLVLAIMRFFMGAMMAAYEPAVYSLVADYFPPEKHSTANSVAAAGTYIGAGLCSLSVILINALGWRNSLNVIGGSGMAIGALVLLFVKEPVRNIFKKYENQEKGIVEEEEPEIKEEQKPIWALFKQSLSDIMSNPVTRLATFGGMFRFFGMFACDYYLPSFFM